MTNTSIALPDESIEDKILLIRGKKVILDHDLARLYGVATKVLNQAARRNSDRFPEDFMFQLTKAETEEWQRLKPLRSQIVILKKARGPQCCSIFYAPDDITRMSSNVNPTRARVPMTVALNP